MSKEIIKNFVYVDALEMGYEIHTSEQVITLMISNSAGCCENWGVITTEDTLPDFVGAELLSIEVIDMDYSAHPLMVKAFGEHGIGEGGACFIDLHTTKGKLQFVLYNQHNGYYGHGVTIKSKQLEYETGV